MKKLYIGSSITCPQYYVDALYSAKQIPGSSRLDCLIENGKFSFSCASSNFTEVLIRELYPACFSSLNHIFLLFNEFYRILDDGGVLIIENEHTAVSFSSLGLKPYTAQELAIFDKNVRDAVLTSNHVLPINDKVDFKLVRTTYKLKEETLQKVVNGELTMDQVPASDILGHTFYLVARKSKRTYAPCAVPNVGTFSMGIYPIVENTHAYVSRALLNDGVWEPAETQLFYTMIRNLATYFATERKRKLRFTNIGANIGWYCVIAGLAHNNIEIDAFEPTPSTVELLNENLRRNNVQNVNVQEAAVSDKVGEAVLYINDDNDSDNSLCVTNYRTGNTEIKVKTTSLDEFYKGRMEFAWPDMLLIDTEGHEQQVFDGAKRMFERGWRPLIVTEFCPYFLSVRGRPTYPTTFVEEYEYDLYIIQQNGSISRTNLESLYKLYDELCDGTELFTNIIFAPKGFDIVNCVPGK